MDRSWADLPVEILNLFLDRLLFADHPRFAAVCKPWLSAASGRTYFRALKFPWLLIPHNPTTTTTTHQTWGVYSPLEGDTSHHLDLPVTPGSGCFGASHGWLFIKDLFGDILGNNYLLNPLTNQKIHLPPTFTIPDEAPYHLLNKAILSSAPTAENIAAGDCIIVIWAIYRGIKLFFCRPGDETWSNFLVPEDVGYVEDFIIRDDKHLYCVNDREEVFVFKFAPQPMLIHMYRPTRTSTDTHGNSSWSYLVECDGELLMILRYTGDYIEDENAPAEDDVDSCDCLWREPSRFEVFKFDPQGVVWVQMKNLGDQILFLCFGCSMSITVDADDSKFRRNCIYFTDDYFHKDGPHKLDWGVLCLDDETVRPIYPNDSQSHECPPLDFQSHKCPPRWLSLNT